MLRVVSAAAELSGLRAQPPSAAAPSNANRTGLMMSSLGLTRALHEKGAGVGAIGLPEGRRGARRPIAPLEPAAQELGGQALQPARQPGELAGQQQQPDGDEQHAANPLHPAHVLAEALEPVEKGLHRERR